MASLSDIKWSTKSYTLKNFARMFELPQLIKITGGYYDRSETDTFGNGQVIRIHCLKSQERIMATDQRGHNLSFPINFSTARFDVYNRLTKTLETRYLRDIVDTYALPQEVEFSQRGDLNFTEYVDNTVKVDESFGKLNMAEIYEEEFFQGNSVNEGLENDTVNSEILHLPLYLKITVAVAEGFKRGDAAKWNAYGKLLSKIVATEVNHSKENESDEIRLFPTQGMGRVRLNNYGHVYPAGMMSVQNSRHETRKHQMGQHYRKETRELPVPKMSNGFHPSQQPSPKSTGSQERLTQTNTQVISYIGQDGDSPRFDKESKRKKPSSPASNPLPNGQQIQHYRSSQKSHHYEYPEQNLLVSIHPLDYHLSSKSNKRNIDRQHFSHKTYHVPNPRVFDEYGYPLSVVRRHTAPAGRTAHTVSRESSFKEVRPVERASRGPSIKELKEISHSSPLVVIPLPDYDI